MKDLNRAHSDLHSTMYLLNQGNRVYSSNACANLHSTMYLLNRSSGIGGGGGSMEFTFHYVSIKSKDSSYM